MASIVEFATDYIIQIIVWLSYPGIVLLMALESACIPVPSEVILPFGGWKLASDLNGVFLVALAGTIGCVIGSLVAYYVGLYAGRVFILRYGKYVLLREKHLVWAEHWFTKYGDAAIFFSRLMPVIRTFISLPAGIGKMEVKRFTVLTAVGSFPWCFALAYLGYRLGDKWDTISRDYGHYLDYIIIAVLIVIGIYYLRKLLKDRKEEEQAAKGE